MRTEYPHLVETIASYCFHPPGATNTKPWKLQELLLPASQTDVNTRAVNTKLSHLYGARKPVIERINFFFSILNKSTVSAFCSEWEPVPHSITLIRLTVQSRENKKRVNGSDGLLILRIHSKWWSETATSLSTSSNILTHTFEVLAYTACAAGMETLLSHYWAV